MWSYLKQFFFKSIIPLMYLPNNVLENIFKYLELKQQLEFASITEHLNTIMQNVRRYSDQEISLVINSNLTNEELSFILMQTHLYLGKIEIHKWNIEQWKMFKQYRYPKAKELSIDNENSFKDEKIYNNLIPDVCDLFPNLKSLRFPALIDFRDRDINHLIKLKSLEDLYISGTFTFKSFQKIFEELRLKSLHVSGIKGPFQWTSYKAFENVCALELFKTRSNWNMLQPNILRYSNLKEIGGLADNDENIDLKEVLHNIVELKPHNITKIILGKEWSLKYLLSHTFPNLKRLDILYQNMNEFNDVLKCAPNLREIVFFYCDNMQEEHVEQILKSTQIEFFDVILCNCKFETISIDVKDIVKGRTKPLSFHFRGIPHREKPSAYDPYVECKFKGKSSLFEIMEMNYCYHYFDHYCIEFQSRASLANNARIVPRFKLVQKGLVPVSFFNPFLPEL